MTWRRAGLLASVLIGLGWVFLAFSRPSDAVKPAGISTAADRRRFGLNQDRPKERRQPRTRSQRAFSAFQRSRGKDWKIRFNPRTGAPAALVHGKGLPRPGGPRAAAQGFLRENTDLTFVDPAALALNRQSFGRKGLSHILYQQTFKGLPVEFARVKVHLDDEGRVIGFNSNFEPEIDVALAPSLASAQAFRSVAGELGMAAEVPGELVIFPSEVSGRNHLAWKYSLRQGWHLWRYYVDAHTGQVLFRYDDMRRQAPCITSGTVTAWIAEIDPGRTPYKFMPLKHQRVYVKDGTHWADTNAEGFFCSDTKGKIFTGMRGPYTSVSNFRGPSAHYDNGGGAWATAATSLSSPHPYPNNSDRVDTVTVNPALNAVKVLPVFSQFNVGTWNLLDGVGDIGDDDQVGILDQNNKMVASYVGNRGPFNGAAVAGNTYKIWLASNESGATHGYDIQISSYLTLSNPTEWNVNGSSVAWWASSHTHIGKGGEFSAFYHANMMHDFFISDIDKSSAAFIGDVLNVNVYVGPDHLGAFYNPTYGNLNFGDDESADPKTAVVDDGTAVRHEYTHYVFSQIFSAPYFGQSGAMEEAIADYFSGSSLNLSSIGQYYNNSLGNPNPIREMSCPPNCAVYSGTNWSGEVHDDSSFLSQSLWEMRTNIVNNLFPGQLATARSCADGLVFESLLFFPESFQEIYDALLTVDQRGAVASCGGANQAGGIITAAFQAHGLPTPLGDSWEPNDGYMSAVDISTLSPLAATIYPAGDIDSYTFGAGPGKISIKLKLPRSGNFYKAYSMRLYDHRHSLGDQTGIRRRIVATARPPLDGFHTVDGQYCESFDCNTTASEVILEYNATEGDFYLLQVQGAESFGFSNSGVNSGTPYSLELAYPRAGAANAAIVSALVDNDLISFSMRVSTFVNIQPFHFAYAQLRDHALNVVPNTQAIPGSGASTYLGWISSHCALGYVTGQVRLRSGFDARFPAVGTIHLEIFGYDVDGSTMSLGYSQPLNLTSSKTKLTTYNSVFNPNEGGKATIKYEVPRPGHITLKLYTLNGSLVATLFDDYSPGGKGSLDWSGANLTGKTVASGVYLLILEGMGVAKSQKIVVVK